MQQHKRARSSVQAPDRPYKYDVLAKIEIGVNRELWLEKRWDTDNPEEVPYFVFVAVTYTVTDLAPKKNFTVLPQTTFFDARIIENMVESLYQAGFDIGLFRKDEGLTDDGTK